MVKKISVLFNGRLSFPFHLRAFHKSPFVSKFTDMFSVSRTALNFLLLILCCLFLSVLTHCHGETQLFPSSDGNIVFFIKIYCSNIQHSRKYSWPARLEIIKPHSIGFQNPGLIVGSKTYSLHTLLSRGQTRLLPRKNKAIEFIYDIYGNGTFRCSPFGVAV